MLQLETVLAIVIILITLNLLVVGFYIITVLKDVKRTVRKAEAIIDEVDETVKDGLEKANALQVPLQALAATTVALTGVIKGSEMVRKATQSIAGGEIDHPTHKGPDKDKKDAKKPKVKRPKFFKKKN